MSIKFMTIILYVEDLPRSEEFYADVLGFERTAGVDGCVTMRRGNAQILLSTPNTHAPCTGPSFTGSIYLYVDDVEACWAELKDRAKVCYPIETFDYGMREFAVTTTAM
jgi:uncharacterized glyoxalase superfamily protein PhnB